MQNMILFELYNQIKQDLISSQLPVGTLYFLLQNLTHEVETVFYQTVNKEREDLQQVEDNVNKEIKNINVNLEDKESSGQE